METVKFKQVAITTQMTSNPEKLPLETKQVALDNMVTLTLPIVIKLYSTENRSK